MPKLTHNSSYVDVTRAKNVTHYLLMIDITPSLSAPNVCLFDSRNGTDQIPSWFLNKWSAKSKSSANSMLHEKKQDSC